MRRDERWRPHSTTSGGEATYAPAVRQYALTWPQLVVQSREAGAGDDALWALHRAYLASQEVFEGFYRGCGEPFECHMVRTASVVLHEHQPAPVVHAALLHSAYDLHRYDHTTRRAPRPSHRRRLQRAIGEEAEALVWGFATLDDWPEGVKAHRDRLAGASTAHRRVLTLYVANELANHLDLGKAYRAGWKFRERLEEHGDAIVDLTRALGFSVIADELEVLFDQHLTEQLPAAVAGRPRPYELRTRRTWQATRPERLARAVRRSVRRNRRRLARRLPAAIRRSPP
jgi:(p)ppGpp synthase/HD superfamily hydrolase